MVKVRILGTGCPRCNELEKMCFNVAAEYNIDADIQKVTNLDEILSYGVIHTPALVINDEVKISGKLPTKMTLLHWLKNPKQN